MSLHIYISKDFKGLTPRFYETLTAERSEKQDLFTPDQILVPNGKTKEWLMMHIAGRYGIAAHLHFAGIEEGMWRILRRMDRDNSFQPALLDIPAIQKMIMAWFLTKSFDRPETRLIRHYIGEPDSRAPNDRLSARKAWQICGKLAALFSEYEYDRPEMIDAWQKGTLTGHYSIEMEIFQKAIYIDLFGAGGLRDQLAEQTGTVLLTLPQYAHQILNHPENLSRPERTVLHIFGFSHFSPSLVDIIGKLKSCSAIHIYHPNPCAYGLSMENSTLLETIQNLKIEKRQIGEKLQDFPGESELVQQWGALGLETLKLISNIIDPDSDKIECIPEERPEKNAANLEVLQYFALTSDPSGFEVKSDDSVSFYACPGIHREVETVYHGIVKHLQDDPQLKLTDIEIRVPDIEKYKPVITAVFDKGGRLPYGFTQKKGSGESLYVKAVLSIIDLIYGDFTRKEIFDLVLNPCLTAAIGITREDALKWLDWCEKLNIYRKVHPPMESGIKPFTWNQGLKRLRLGRIMEPSKDERRPFEAYHDIVPYRDPDSQEGRLCGKLSLFIETLRSRIIELTTQSFSCHEFRIRMETLLDDFLDIPENRPEEGYIRIKISEALLTLEKTDDLLRLADPSKRMTPSYLIEYIRYILPSIILSDQTARGVTISPITPTDILPRKIVYVLGMGESDFPKPSEASTLNLLSAYRKIGDARNPESAVYAFLGTVFSAQNKLIFSYVSRNLQKDQTLHPSPLLHRLNQFIKRHISSSAMEITRVPFNGGSEKYLAPETSDILYNSFETDRLLSLYNLMKEGKISDTSLIDAVEKLISERLPDFSVDTPNLSPAASAEIITLNELADFLRNPAGASIKRHMGLFEDTVADAALKEDEPFFSTFPATWRVPTDIYEYGVETRESVEKIIEFFRLYYRYHQQSSAFPAHHYGKIDAEKFSRRIIDRLQNTETGKTPFQEFFEYISPKRLVLNATIGESRIDAPSDIRFPPPSIDIVLPKNGENPIPVEIHGSFPFLWLDENNRLTDALILTESRINDRFTKHLLPAFLFYTTAVLINAASEKTPFSVYIFHKEGFDHCIYPGITRTDAKDYLTHLVIDYLTEGAYDLLPFDLIVGAPELRIPFEAPVPPEDDDPVSDYPEKLRLAIEEDRDTFSPEYRSSQLLDLIRPEVPADAYEKVKRRYRPVFNFTFHPEFL